MPNIKIGCAGWAYDDWIGPFYPSYISKDRFLTHYSKYFDIVETNSTHYSVPKESILKKWAASVPEDFKFCVKIWNGITHIKDYGLGIQNLYSFFNTLNPINDMIAYYLFQFPPSFKKTDNHIDYIKEILKKIDTEKKIVIELRDNSWFDSSLLKELINGINHILGTVYLNDIIPLYPDWQKSYYIRVIGDRTLTKFDKVQREMSEIWAHLSNFLKKNENNTHIEDIFVIFNNHYSGFSPADSNRLKKILGLPIRDFNKKSNITDYFKI